MKRWPRIAAAVAALGVVAGCGNDEPTTAESPSAIEVAASEAAAAAEQIEATTTPEPPPDHDDDGVPDVSGDYPFDPERWRAVEVILDCYLDESFDAEQVFTVVDADFTQVWAAEPYSCDASRDNTEFSEIEQAAFDASGYDDRGSIAILYEICAEVDPTDTYVSGEHTASPEQIPEITAVLVLCPDHPLADEFAATLERGQVEVELKAEGLLFGGGSYLVGDEIQPGTYVIEGEIDDCYWERQDSSGGIIGNSFIISARRVEVTIRSSDYAFFSEGCGQWRAQ